MIVIVGSEVLKGAKASPRSGMSGAQSDAIIDGSTGQMVSKEQFHRNQHDAMILPTLRRYQ